MIYALADLHLDPLGNKSMDIFGEKWIGHREKIIKNWNELVKDNDLVLLPGDISWGLKLEEARTDLELIDSLKGHKIISKGNHDYWWSSLNKLRNLNLKTIDFLMNNSYIYNDVEIFGTRGWKPKDHAEFVKEDEKIFNREILRLKNSLDSAKTNYKKVVMLHYPPFNQDLTPNEFSKVLTEYGVNICIYGHLHGPGHKLVVEGIVNNVLYKCVSGDYVDFRLQEI